MQSSNLKLNESKEALFTVRNYNFFYNFRLEIQQ